MSNLLAKSNHKLFFKSNCFFFNFADIRATFCGANIKPIGCFQDSRNDRIFPVLLDSHRDGSFHHNKFMINWMKYKNSLET